MARLLVSYRVEKVIDIEIPEFALTGEEVNKLVAEAVEETIPADTNVDWGEEWGWVIEPRLKGSQERPPAEWMMETPLGKVATNGQCIVFDQENAVMLKTSRLWRDANQPERAENISETLSKDFRSMPLHKGWFDRVFMPYEDLAGLEVRGEGVEALAYVISQSKLIACIMPLRIHDETRERSSRFQFNRD